MRADAVAIAAVFSVVVSVVGCGGGATEGPTATAPTSAAPSVCATFYADGDLQGATLVAKAPGDDQPKIPSSFNDNMSSVAVTSGCTVMAYADADYGGQEFTFTETTKAIPPAFNDQMSSFKCACR